MTDARSREAGKGFSYLYHREGFGRTSLKRQRRNDRPFAGASGLCGKLALDRSVPDPFRLPASLIEVGRERPAAADPAAHLIAESAHGRQPLTTVLIQERS